jgi:hypothetical protein
MGETLGISVNMFERKEREKDRKERTKALEEWNREKKQVSDREKEGEKERYVYK